MRAFLCWRTFARAGGWDVTSGAGAGEAITMLLGPQQPAPAPFTEVIPSWSAETPAGSWIEVQLRARRAGRWTRFYQLARWDNLREGSARRSFDVQADDDGRVATDTLVLAGPADLIQPRLLLHATAGAQPALAALHLALSARDAARAPHARPPACELPVPLRSQMAYPNGSGWCSPTAITMLLAYWHLRTGDQRLAPFMDHSAIPALVAPQVYDPAYDGCGNWAFNTAFAASQGLTAYVTRLDGLDQIAPWVRAGVPLIISVAWKPGALNNAAVPSSNGHLLVVIGFDEHGHVITADPAGADERAVRRIYDAAQLEAAWQDNSQGAAYLIHPSDWPTPAPGDAPWL